MRRHPTKPLDVAPLIPTETEQDRRGTGEQLGSRELAGPPESASAFRALAEEYTGNDAIPVPLRRLLTCALTSVPPPRTVKRLAHLPNSDPSTIRRHWRRGVNSHGIQRIKDLLDWLVLLRALAAKRPGLSWRLVATRVGTNERTLRRLAVRLTGDTLGAVGVAGAERPFEHFAESLAASFCAKSS